MAVNVERENAGRCGCEREQSAYARQRRWRNGKPRGSQLYAACCLPRGMLCTSHALPCLQQRKFARLVIEHSHVECADYPVRRRVHCVPNSVSPTHMCVGVCVFVCVYTCLHRVCECVCAQTRALARACVRVSLHACVRTCACARA